MRSKVIAAAILGVAAMGTAPGALAQLSTSVSPAFSPPSVSPPPVSGGAAVAVPAFSPPIISPPPVGGAAAAVPVVIPPNVSPPPAVGAPAEAGAGIAGGPWPGIKGDQPNQPSQPMLVRQDDGKMAVMAGPSPSARERALQRDQVNVDRDGNVVHNNYAPGMGVSPAPQRPKNDGIQFDMRSGELRH